MFDRENTIPLEKKEVPEKMETARPKPTYIGSFECGLSILRPWWFYYTYAQIDGCTMHTERNLED